MEVVVFYGESIYVTGIHSWLGANEREKLRTHIQCTNKTRKQIRRYMCSETSPTILHQKSLTYLSGRIRSQKMLKIAVPKAEIPNKYPISFPPSITVFI